MIIGLIGTGYMGKRLLSRPEISANSWCTQHVSPVSDVAASVVHFSFEDATSWANLPEEAQVLVITSPPANKQDVAANTLIMTQWSQWMRLHRPRLSRVIYISSTGVYPERQGRWKESDVFDNAKPRAALRLETERVLQASFSTQVIRAGGIYGPGRNLKSKVEKTGIAWKGGRPIHRIHVDDLVSIAIAMASEDIVEPILNAVDQHPASMDEVVDWMIQTQNVTVTARESNPAFDATTAGLRIICNEKLMQQDKFTLLYPDYKKGLSDSEFKPD